MEDDHMKMLYHMQHINSTSTERQVYMRDKFLQSEKNAAPYVYKEQIALT